MLDLNLVKKVALNGSASLCVNGVVHPMCMIMNTMFFTQRLPSIVFSLSENRESLSRNRVAHLTLRQLYRGYNAMCGVDASSFFAAYLTNDFFRSRFDPLPASIAAGFVATPCIAIGEGLMILRQVHHWSYATALRQSLKWSGMITTLFREAPFFIGVFAMTPRLTQQFKFFKNDSLRLVIASSVTGFVVGALTTPFDKIKTRIQAEPTLAVSLAARGIFNTFFKYEVGWRGIYTAFSLVIVSTVYNSLPKYLDRIA